MPDPIRMAVVDDDKLVNEMFAQWLNDLEVAGRPVVVDRLHTFDEAETAFTDKGITYDLICLDIELKPQKSAGFTLLYAIIEQKRHGPVIVISGVDEAAHAPIVRAMPNYDYLAKPIDPDKKDEFQDFVLLNLRPHLKKKSAKATIEDSSGNDFDLALSKVHPQYKNKNFALSGVRRRILNCLIENKGKLVTYDKLFECCPFSRKKDNVRGHIAAIRKELMALDPNLEPIRTVEPVGYIWTQ